MAAPFEIRIEELAPRPTLVVAARTTWQEFPALWKELLDEVWTCLRAGGVERGARNVMLYLDDAPNVEVGVLYEGECPPVGRVTRSALPAGTAVTAVHHGPWAELDSAHRAVRTWCAEHGHVLAGPSWEVYGPHDDDPAKLRAEVSYLVGRSSM